MNNGFFEGGFRRAPEQNLAGASAHSGRGDFLRKIHYLRFNRQLDVKKTQSIVKIQAFVRGFLTRKRIQNSRENTLLLSYANGHGLLDLPQLSEQIISFCFLKKNHSPEVLGWLTHLAIENHESIIKGFFSFWEWKIKWLMKIHLQRINSVIGSSAQDQDRGLESSLQFFTAFTDHKALYTCLGLKEGEIVQKKIFEYVICNGYYEAAYNILHYNNPGGIGFVGDNSHFNYVEEMIRRSVKIMHHCGDNSYASLVVVRFCQHFLIEDITEEIRSIVFPVLFQLKDSSFFYLLMAVVEGNVRPSGPCLFAILEYFRLGNFFKDCTVGFCEFMESMAVLLRNLAEPRKHQRDSFFEDEPIIFYFNIDDEDDEDEDDDWRSEMNNLDDDDDERVQERAGQNVASTNKVAVELYKAALDYLKSVEFAQSVMGFIESNYCPKVLIYTAKFIRTLISRQAYGDFKILWYMAFHPNLSRDYWLLLIDLRREVPMEKPVPLLTILSKGYTMTDIESDVFYSVLVTFCFLFKRFLCMQYREDFEPNECAGFIQGGHPKKSELCIKLRDIALALLNNGYPDTPIVVNSELKEQNLIPMNESYHVVINLLRVLYYQEIDIDPSFWISRKVSVSITIVLISEEPLLANHIIFDDKTLCERSLNTSNYMVKTYVLLRDLSYTIPLKDRMIIYQEFFHYFKSIHQRPNEYSQDTAFIKIRRDFIYEDAFNKLSQDKVDIRKVVKIQFVNQFGFEESGVDGGGIFKEFVCDFLKAAFDPHRGFFLLNTEQQLYPNPNVEALYPNFKSHYYFIGRMVAKALFENIATDMPFAQCFISNMIKRDRDVNLRELQSLDPELYKNLLYLMCFNGDVSSLELNFTCISDLYGQTKVNELVPGGDKIAVNASNKAEYVQSLLNFKLYTQFALQCKYFRQGMESVFSLYWLALFSAKELKRLVFCSDMTINVEDLKRNCYYLGGYSSAHPNIIKFWTVFESLQNSDKRLLLKFVTSCSCQPFLGFKELDPPFTIQLIDCKGRLPTASTCMNLLKLPLYQDEAAMREKILYSIKSQAGFDLC